MVISRGCTRECFNTRLSHAHLPVTSISRDQQVYAAKRRQSYDGRQPTTTTRTDGVLYYLYLMQTLSPIPFRLYHLQINDLSPIHRKSGHYPAPQCSIVDFMPLGIEQVIYLPYAVTAQGICVGGYLY